ncbi:lysylphosphatidylglycerol synthase domain-containing protein [Longimycelium tulufanense]|uniref:lysylphosphatidylglycerol synthase domain-containing protein n=1 Tax=Longimycelium tulufanense TaxID=907463 RepID=UPI001E3932FB|nr:lysylphosphatidylglycerol synthase domain-containing protein [Longimycelium tulufanense]
MASLVIGAVLIAVALPKVAGVDWGAIGTQFGALDAPTVLWLVVLWLAGLWAYTYVLTGSLPGLTNAQALTLNATGSAVSNVLPFGGAAGVALTFAMAGSWGHARRAVAVSTLVTGVWNTLARMALPALGLLALVAAGRVPDERMTVAAEVAAVSLAAVLALTVAVLAWGGAAPAIGRAVDAVVRVLPGRWRPRPGRAGEALRSLRAGTVDIVRRGWRKMTIGMVAYLGLQGVLFAACLSATGAHVGFGEMVAAFALGRLLTTAVVTPSGVGVSENGTVALLVALGCPAAPVAAAVLLFAFFTYAIEIPLGGLGWLAWVSVRRWRVAPARPHSVPQKVEAAS